MAKTKRPSSAASTGPGRIQLLVDSVIDYAIYMLDLEGRVESWNAGAARLKGYSLDEILGQHFSRFYTPEDRAAGVPAFALKTARETGRFHAEGWRVRKDGTRFWASVVIDPIRNHKGELIGYAKVTRDMTEQRTAIQALLESEGRYRQLIEAVVDYATSSIARATSRHGIPALGASRVTAKRKSSGSISAASTPKKIAPKMFRNWHCSRPRPPANSRRKAGACAKMAPHFGR
jgi:PAS domain S-box-containing protein